MFKELGISLGTYLIVLISLYFVIKWAVKNGIQDAYEEIKDEKTTDGIEEEESAEDEE